MNEDESQQQFGSLPEKDDDDDTPLSHQETQELTEEGVILAKQPQTVPSLDFEKLFNEIFLEVFDVESGLDRAMENYTKVLLSRGIDVNPSGVYQQIELIQTRLTKLNIVKRLCSALGLIDEMDRILEHEMGLIYQGSRPAPQRPVKQYSRVTDGDIDQGGNDNG